VIIFFKHIIFLLQRTSAPIGALVLFVLSVNAQQNQPTDTLKTKHLNDAVVTGQYGENSLKNSVFKVKVIDAQRIQQQGAVNLKDVLANEINIRINQDPSLGSSINLQGVTGQNIKILIDGVPVIGREGGNVDLTQINLNNVERIELVEGPMSVNFGSDALGGVINIITKKSVAKTRRFNLGTYHESIGQYNIDGGLNFDFKRTQWQINGGRNFFDGYNENEKITRFKLWKPREQYFADVTVSFSGKTGNWRIQNNWFTEKVTSLDSGIVTPFYAYGLDQYYYTTRSTTSVFWDKKLKNNFAVNIIGSGNYYKRVRNTLRKDLVSLQEEQTTAAELNDTNYFYLLMSRGFVSKNKNDAKVNYQIGYEINHEFTEGGKIADGEQQFTDYNIFASTELKPTKKITLRPGIRAIYHTKFNAPLVPAINLKWEITSYLKLRASYARGFRAPSLKEMYLKFVDPSHNVQGNPNLKAETGDNLQLFTTFEMTKQKHMFRFEPSLFYNHISNMIDLAMVNAQTIAATYINVGEFTSRGINFNMEYKTPVYGIQAGYAATGRNNSYATDNKFYTSNEVRVNFTATHPKKNTSLALFYKYNGKLQAYQYNYTNNEVMLGYINAFNVLDATISQPFFKKRLNTTLGVKNILDVRNVRASIVGGVHQSSSNNAMIAMGRTLFFSIRYSINQIKQ
jgi:outer membrane receptor for ferrienterochelin and colicins